MSIHQPSTLNPQPPKGYKQTEVGVIPEEWEVRPLGRLATMVASGRSRAGVTFGTYPVHGSTGIIGYTEKPEYKGDAILAARVGANAGKLNLVAGQYGVTDNTIMVCLNSCYCLTFFWRQLESKRLNSLVFGSGQPLITGTQLKAVLLCVPSLREQRAIAGALGDVDALLGALQKLIAKKRDLKQAAMQQLLTGQTCLPGFHSVWEVKRLGDVCGRITTGKLDANAMVTDGDYPFFTCARENYWIDKYAFDYEALLVSGNGANVGYVHYYNGKFNAYQRTYVISEFTADVQFIKVFLIRNIQDRIRVEVNAGNTPYITMGTLTEMEIILPPTLPEQTAIAGVLSDMDAGLAALEQRLAKTRALKQGMMQELLTGRIRLV